MIDKKLVESLANERMAELDDGLYIVSLTISSGNKILLELDKKKGFVSIDDCISISRNIEHNLDREAEDFSLEVASAGLNQPFRVLDQYKKNIGKVVKVQTLEHGKAIEGTLTTANETGFVVERKEKQRVEGKKKKEWVTEEFSFKYDQIKETKLIISF
jgi:ribosome maturation factor RimP